MLLFLKLLKGKAVSVALDRQCFRLQFGKLNVQGLWHFPFHWKRTRTWHLESICSPLKLPNLDKPEGPRISLPLAYVGLSEAEKDSENNNIAISNLQWILSSVNPKGFHNLKRISRFVFYKEIFDQNSFSYSMVRTVLLTLRTKFDNASTSS